MATGGILGNGTKVAFSASSPVSWTRVGQLMDIPKFISLIASKVDTTVHSTSNVKTSMPGMSESPEVELSCLGDLNQATSASFETLRGYQGNGTVVYWRIEIPTDRSQSAFRAWEFQGYVQEWTPDTKIAAAQMLKMVIVYSGGLTVYNSGASAIT